MIRKHALDGNSLTAMSLFREMLALPNYNTTLLDDPFIYASLMKACNKVRAIREGKSVHCRVTRRNLDCNVYVLNSLVYFYSNSAGLVAYAREVFDRMPERTVVTVNCMVSGYVNSGVFDAGLGLFVQVMRGFFGWSVKPNCVTLVILISGCVECGWYRAGGVLHCYCCKTRLDLNKEVRNVLIDFYANSGCVDDSATMFGDMPEKDLVSWNTMMAGYFKNNDYRKGFSLFKEMRKEYIVVDRVSLLSLISVCANGRFLLVGKMIHGYIKQNGIETCVALGTALINMYSKCGAIEFARKVFDELPKQNIATWNSLIHGYVVCRLHKEALILFNLVQSRKLEVDEITMLGVILACRNSGKLNDGISVHSFIESSNHLTGNTVLCNALMDMYVKCGSMTRARAVFDNMPRRDVISWTSIITGHAINGEGEEALVAFQQMSDERVMPNSITFIGLLSACNHAGLLDDGRRLYGIMRKEYHIEPKIEHCGCVVDMHARAGMLEEAQQFVKNMSVEPNAIIWRMLMNACRVHNHYYLGLSIVHDLIELRALYRPDDHVILSNILAEAGKWDDVLRQRNLMIVQGASKVAGKSSVSYIASSVF
ncbi:hypothetical protein RJ640_010596 [Escallonia rubra]|uniref:Pentatricopeptide repeat-containing protein n=1 Tax=Escallonia rubra TaxID=112253 RepID=A0AA88R6C0_9ASTE|nr:hypothetical protein RJ640_010596 [Escallonia rubra]